MPVCWISKHCSKWVGWKKSSLRWRQEQLLRCTGCMVHTIRTRVESQNGGIWNALSTSGNESMSNSWQNLVATKRHFLCSSPFGKTWVQQPHGTARGNESAQRKHISWGPWTWFQRQSPIMIRILLQKSTAMSIWTSSGASCNICGTWNGRSEWVEGLKGAQEREILLYFHTIT